jgi:hypothetical protein
MFNLSNKLEIVRKFLSVLTWEKLFQVSVLLLILIFSWAIFENRSSIYNFINQNKISNRIDKNIKLSKNTIKELESSVSRSVLIVGVQVVLVDFQNNTRYIIHTYTDNRDLARIYGEFIDSNISQEFPLFGLDESDNNRLVALINGESMCYKFDTSIVPRYLPEAKRYIDTICSSGIPPFYGKFTGIIVLYLSRNPSPEEIFQVKSLSKKLSATIYENDLK